LLFLQQVDDRDKLRAIRLEMATGPDQLPLAARRRGSTLVGHLGGGEIRVAERTTPSGGIRCASITQRRSVLGRATHTESMSPHRVMGGPQHFGESRQPFGHRVVARPPADLEGDERGH